MSPPRSIPSAQEGRVGVSSAKLPLRPSDAGFSPILKTLEKQISVLPDFYSREETQSHFLRNYLRDARIQTSFRFDSTFIPVEGSPDLHLREGAGICSEARVQGGQLSIPQPLQLSGFYALAGLYEFCSVDSDAQGKLHLKSCGCSLPKDSDITEAALKGPMENLFPEKRLHPVSLQDLLISLKKPTTPGAGKDPLLSALRSVSTNIRISNGHWIDDPPGTPGGSCHPQWASLEAYFDIPSLRANLSAGLWQSFDFSGVERGSKMEWPRFNLADLPLPEGWAIPEGEADIELRYFPQDGETQIQVRNLKAKGRLAALFGSADLKMEGDLKVLLKRGGEVSLQLEDFRIEAPLFSIPGGRLPNVSVSLNGNVNLHMKDEARTLSDLDLELNDLQFQIPESTSSSGVSWAGTLLGQGHLKYEGQKNHWSRIELGLSGDVSVMNGKPEALLRLEGLGIDLSGNEETIQLKLDALKMQYGSANFLPKLAWEFQPRFENNSWEINGNGTLALDGVNIPLSLVTEGELQSDLQSGTGQFKNLSLDFGGQTWSRRGALQVNWEEKGLNASLHLPDLPGGTSLDLKVRSLGDSERLSGHFDVRPSRMNLASGLSAENLRWRGSFLSDPLSKIMSRPRVSLDTKLSGNLNGLAEGPFQAELKGSLSYSPSRRSIFLWLNPRRASSFNFGPMRIPGAGLPVEGELPLQGTWQAVLLPGGILVGGRGVGIRDGVVRVRNGETALPLIEGFDLLADQLWSIQKGMAYAGGDGIRLEGSFDTSVWLGNSVQGLGKRKVFLAVDQLPLSLDSFWKLFAASLKEPGGKD